ncbi:DUF7305 domain-containing protein [Planococcus alpniumensis]|uniref:DUF7305 domain-containing protein n=1 Tax=Planococcus alpniumensis TaxID=2708345 RepID=UPI001B8C1964|nr:PilX N-terminal domain-containing pilus assembly protein [Planococcus sp. MSAK28401]
MKKHSGNPLKIMTNNEGISLVMVLFVLVVISILGLSMMGMAANNLTQSTGEQDFQSAFYIAEGGAVKAMEEINEEKIKIESNTTSSDNFFQEFELALADLNSRVIDSFAPHAGETPVATITIEKISLGKYKLTSVGEIGSRKREVSGHFNVQYTQGSRFSIPTNLSLYTEEQIELTGGAQVNGSVGTELTSNGSIKMDGGAGISNQILVPVGSSPNPINAPNDLLSKHVSKISNYSGQLVPRELPAFPEYPSYQQMADVTIGGQYNRFKVIDNGNLNITSWQAQNYILNLTSDVYFKNINVAQNIKLTIETGNKDRAIVVDNLNLATGQIQITGTGKLTIYVTQNMAFGSGNFNLDGSRDKLEIFLKGTAGNTAKKHINIAADMKINGSLYAENANITFTGGGGFLGHVLTGGDNLTISGGARVGSSLIFAPNAGVKLLGGGKVDGSIISKSYYANGGTILKYVPINHESIPMIGELGSSESEVEIIPDPFRES